MPTPKNPNQKKGAAGKPAASNPAVIKKGDADLKISEVGKQALEKRDEAAAPAVDAGRSAVIAELIKSGMSYEQAVASMGGAAAPAGGDNSDAKIDVGKDPGADEVIDEASIPDPGEELELFVAPLEPRDGYTMMETLYELRKEIDNSRKKKRFKIEFEIDQRLFDWLLYATIAEANFRRRPELSIGDYLEIKLKETKAADPTQGGRRNPTTSGPKELFNPGNKNWGG